MNSILTLMLSLMTVPNAYRMMVISDPHVLDSTLYDVNSAAMKSYMDTALKQQEYAQAAFIQLVDKALVEKPDVVLIPGDLTMAGSRVDHLSAANQLRRLYDANIPVCLIPGNHDINGTAYKYTGTEREKVPVVDDQEFDSIYAFLNTSWPSLRQDPNSHSYVVTLAPRLTLIGADCAADGAFTDATLNWVFAQADSAVIADDRVIAMMHYQLLETTDEYGKLLPEALVDNHSSIAGQFRLHGIELVLTGHMHSSNITTNYINHSRDSIVDISSATPAMYPNPYCTITASDTWGQFKCETNYITSMPGYSDFTSYAKKHVEDNIQNVKLREIYDLAWEYRDSVGPMIDSIPLDKKINAVLELLELGKSDIKELANNLIAQVPSDSKKRADYINSFVGADAATTAIIYIEGNEGEKNTEDLKKNLIKDVYNLAYDLIDKAYPYNEEWWTKVGIAQNAKRQGWFNKAETIYQIVSPYEEAPWAYRYLDAVKEVKAKIKDFLDGFFGDYTNYKDDDQNRTDDLRPTLRFAALPEIQPTNLSAPAAEMEAQKIMIDGHLYILRNGVVYHIDGTRL